jgi:sugar phosphate isomerase/epimerase
MQVGIRDDMVFAAGFDTLGAGLKALGVDAVELVFARDGSVRSLAAAGQSVDLDTAAGREALREQCSTAGVSVAALMLANNFNAEDVAAEVDWVCRAADAARALGVRALRVDSIMKGERDMSFPGRVEAFAAAMKQVVKATDGWDVAFGIENHGWGGNDPEFLMGVIALVGSPRVGVTLDTGNFYWAGNPLSELYGIYERLAPHVKATHVKSIRYPEEVRDTRREMGYRYGEFCSPLDEGDIDLARVIRILKGAGYDGSLTIENESLGRFPAGERAGVLKRDVAHLRRLLA